MFSVAQFLALVWISCMISVAIASENEIETDCYPNSTIVVSNPRPDMHYAIASDSDDECDLTFSTDFTLITLTGCSKNETIVVQLCDTEITNNIIGGTGSHIVHVNIMCKEIEQGVQRNITQVLGSSLVMNESSSIDTTFQGSSFVRKNSFIDPPSTSIPIDENVFFTYDLYEGYVMRFLQCTAYPGRDTTTFQVSHKLIENDCTTDSVRIDSFSPSKITIVDSHTRYYTGMRMFRFWLSLYVTIVCDIRICRDDSSAQCTMATCDNTRRRRQTVEVSNKDVQHITTRSTFKVLDVQDVFLPLDMSSETSTISGSFVLYMVPFLMML